jgi:membrane protease YdiL (CAAX protease family)
MAALLVLIVFGVQTVLSVPLGIIDLVFEQVLHRPPPQLEREPLLIGGINIVALGAGIAFGLYLNRLSFRRAFPVGGIPLRQAGAAAITVLGMAILLSEVDNVFRALCPPPMWLLNMLEDSLFAHDKILARALLLVVIAPISEELLFRGIILRGLLSRYRPAAAVVLTALLFAILHANPWQFFSALFLGIVFGWFYLRTGSIALCILAHAMANGLNMLSTMIPLDIPGLTGTPDNSVVVFQPWWLDLCGLGMLMAGVWAFYRATPQVREQPLVPPPIPPEIIDPSAKTGV